MKSPEWHQNVLLVSKDHEFQQKLSEAFGDETRLIKAETREEAEKHYQDNPDERDEIKVLLIDSEAFKDKNKKMIHEDYISLAEKVIKTNHRLVTILFANKTPKNNVLEQLDQLGIHALLDRKDFTVNIVQYLIRIFRCRTFRTIVLDDFSNNFKTPNTLYHFLPKNNRFIPIIPKDTQYCEKIREKLIKANTFQVYSKHEDYKNVLQSLVKSNPSRELISVHLNDIRDLYIRYLSNFFNISKASNHQKGKAIFEQGEQIIKLLEDIIEVFVDPLDCIRQLPYKRWSDISHSMNCAIFVLIFGKYLKVKKYKEVAHAALYHNIGLSQIDQKIVTMNIHGQSANDKIEYQKHVEHSICMLKLLRMPLNLWQYAVVYQHHECYDGTGYPKSVAGKKILPQAELLSLCGAFNHILTMHNDNRFRSVKEAWELLQAQNSFENNQTKQAFSPETLEKLSHFIEKPEASDQQHLEVDAEDIGASESAA